jgi:hypothetical protein
MQHQTKHAEFWFAHDLLFIKYKQDISITGAIALQIVKDRIQIQKGLAYCICCDVRGVKRIDKPARNYLAYEGAALCKAVVFLVDYPLSQMLSDFYIRTSRPPIPMKICMTMEEALTYLELYKYV